jgi:general stress protein 26
MSQGDSEPQIAPDPHAARLARSFAEVEARAEAAERKVEQLREALNGLIGYIECGDDDPHYQVVTFTPTTVELVLARAALKDAG